MNIVGTANVLEACRLEMRQGAGEQLSDLASKVDALAASHGIQSALLDDAARIRDVVGC